MPVVAGRTHSRRLDELDDLHARGFLNKSWRRIDRLLAVFLFRRQRRPRLSISRRSLRISRPAGSRNIKWFVRSNFQPAALVVGPVRARVIEIVYLTAAVIATMGWVWLLFYCLALLFSP